MTSASDETSLGVQVEHTRPVLIYPCGLPPEKGEVVEVAPGVMWIRMPLPLSISHINLWVLSDGDKWVLVDTGLHTPEIKDAWCSLLSGALASRQVGRVIVTHMHPDHVGMAGWLTHEAGCALWMTRLEYLSCRVLAADTGKQAPNEGIEFYRRAGWSAEAMERYKRRFGEFGQGVSALPESFQRIADGDTINVGANEWKVIVGTGHSPEHACLYCPELDLMLSGDQVLPGISSNISVFPTEPDADPLGDWLESIDKIRRKVPDTVLVLPAHQKPFRGLHARLDYMQADQFVVLDRLKAAIHTSKRVVDVLNILFQREISPESSVFHLATGEAIACLNYLIKRGMAFKQIDDQGIAWYMVRN